jgi:hypothetical protein
MMMALHVACFLSVFVCAGAYAQTCSGGAGGGMDATGNQCSAAGNDLDSVQAAPVITRATAASASRAQAHARSTGSWSTTAKASEPQIAAVGQLAARHAVTASSSAELVQSVNLKNAP